MSKFYIYDHDKEEALMVKDKSDFMSWLNDHADKDRYSFFSTQEKMESYLGKVLEKDEENFFNIVPCKNGVGEWEISPIHETFDTREEAEKRLRELKDE
jgi:hypothetical protein